MVKLRHKVVLVTGGNSGIGRALSVQGAPDHIRGNGVRQPWLEAVGAWKLFPDMQPPKK